MAPFALDGLSVRRVRWRLRVLLFRLLFILRLLLLDFDLFGLSRGAVAAPRSLCALCEPFGLTVGIAPFEPFVSPFRDSV